MASSRSYDNTLRQQQSDQTREKILDGLLAMASDPSIRELSIPKLAKLAGVSQPTVYRHFPNREALVQGFEERLKQRIPVGNISDDPMKWPSHFIALFNHFDDSEELVRASLREGWGADFRRQTRQRRLTHIRQRIEATFKELPPLKRQQLFGLIQHLGSSDAWRSLKDNAGLSGADAGEAVAWALETLLSAAHQPPEPTADSGDDAE